MKKKYWIVAVIGFIMGWEVSNGYYLAATCGLIISFFVYFGGKYEN